MKKENKSIMTKEQIKARIYSFYTTDYFREHKVSCYTIIEHKRILEEAIESDDFNQDEKNYCKAKLICYQEELERQLNLLQKETKREDFLKIPTNNKQSLEVNMKEGKLFFEKKSPLGNTTRIDSLTEEDIVLLYDYILQQRDSGKEIF